MGDELSELRYFESGNGLDWTPRPIQGRHAIDLPKRGWLRGHVFKSAAPNDPMPYKHVEEGVVPVAQVEALLAAHPERVDPRSFRSDVPGIYGLFGAQSADGLVWQTLDQPIALQHSDTQTIGYYDPERGDYVLYTRTWDPPTTSEDQALAKPTSWIAAGRRSIGMTENPVFGDFPLSRTVLTPSASMKPSEQFYYNCRTALPGAPDQHVMFPGVYDIATDVIEAHFAASPDGSAWSLSPEGALIGARPDQAWERGTIIAHPNLIRTQDGYAVLPHAGFSTPLFITSGDRILIDAQTDATGYIRFEHFSQAKGRMLLEKDSVPFNGDSVRHEIAWSHRNRLPIDPGMAIKLRFSLYRARLYAIRFERHD